MKALADVANIVNDATGVDTYQINIPENVSEDTDAALITEVLSSMGVEGNGEIYGLMKRVQIQVFYAVETTLTPDVIESKILTSMAQQSWRLVSFGGHLLDPDTKQLYVTMQFEKHYFISEEE